jgi:hypothetical protein
VPITDKDRAIAKDFCDQIGCTTVHHLRDELPQLVATVREAEQARCVAVVETEDDLTGASTKSSIAARIRETAGGKATS